MTSQEIPDTRSTAPSSLPVGTAPPVAVEVPLYVAHQTIYPRSVSGLFSKWRWGVVFLTQLVFYGLPWLQWGQRQAVLFDVNARRFYIKYLYLCRYVAGWYSLVHVCF